MKRKTSKMYTNPSSRKISTNKIMLQGLNGNNYTPRYKPEKNCAEIFLTFVCRRRNFFDFCSPQVNLFCYLLSATGKIFSNNIAISKCQKTRAVVRRVFQKWSGACGGLSTKTSKIYTNPSSRNISINKIMLRGLNVNNYTPRYKP